MARQVEANDENQNGIPYEPINPQAWTDHLGVVGYLDYDVTGGMGVPPVIEEKVS